ncbi:MAG: hypothetical protein DLM72_15260 [Candidatus Nitrosopolaris wilkensis]|nr:MAG: hypothetical protein DLM72_15260 [Candidatus Nitrosopolaris wilkensis]
MIKSYFFSNFVIALKTVTSLFDSSILRNLVFGSLHNRSMDKNEAWIITTALQVLVVDGRANETKVNPHNYWHTLCS